jgi:CheY-like chemotaxis protein
MDSAIAYSGYMDKIKTLYIIDDDEIMVYLSRTLIDQTDFFERCEVFNSAQAALGHIHEFITNDRKLPDVILLDINMPVMDGWEFLDELEKLAWSTPIPIFIFSSLIDNASKERMLSYPFVKGYIQKPLTIIKLNKILRLIS